MGCVHARPAGSERLEGFLMGFASRPAGSGPRDVMALSTLSNSSESSIAGANAKVVSPGELPNPTDTNVATESTFKETNGNGKADAVAIQDTKVETKSTFKETNGNLKAEKDKEAVATQDVSADGPLPPLKRSSSRVSINGPDKYMLRAHTNMRPSNLPKHLEGEQVAAGWPPWLTSIAGEALVGWIPRRADAFEKLSKVGQGTYSNVYKARDLDSGKIVALKKVKFDNLEPESVRFMLREIHILRRLDHPNIIKLQGLVTSRMSCSLYLVFEYMEHDLVGLISCPETSFTEAHIKCVFKQLLLGLDHCHKSHVLHRDIKGSNLLLDSQGNLKIADFGLASFFDPEHTQARTSRVVTLWYRSPELLLGATIYGAAIDMWSAGCILAELFSGKPIMPGKTEVEQLHKIFTLCGSPTEEYWKTSNLPHASMFKSQQPYKRRLSETYKDFPTTAMNLLECLLLIDPAQRGTAADALQSKFFKTEPFACDPSNLPKFPPSKEYDARQRLEAAWQAEMQAKFGKESVLGDSKHDNGNWIEPSQVLRVSKVLTKSKSTELALADDASFEMERSLQQASTRKVGPRFLTRFL